jgi:hypothetical protein
MISVIGKGVDADMHLMEKNLSVLDLGIGILDIDLAVSHGLDFGAFQDDTRLILVFDEVIEPGFSVVRTQTIYFALLRPFALVLRFDRQILAK